MDNPNICNQSIYLEHGPNSAAILKLTSKESYSTKELYCTVNFKAPIHKCKATNANHNNERLRFVFICAILFSNSLTHSIVLGSGLTGILEEMDLRKYVDNGHHLGQSFCVDHIRVMTHFA